MRANEFTEGKIKGIDGKACWPGKRYAGTKNGKDICIPVGEQQLDELDFLGSPCTKDCSGHRAGYEWSKQRGNINAASHSPSFNNGASLARMGK
jgi:hypothetical protein